MSIMGSSYHFNGQLVFGGECDIFGNTGSFTLILVLFIEPLLRHVEPPVHAEELVRAGAEVKYRGRPYPYAKLIIVDNQAFLGSQNISVSSLDRNRETGILFTGSPVDQAVRWFRQDFGNI